MSFRFLFVFILTFFVLNFSAFSQELTPSEIYEQSEADLVIVGKIDFYDRGYSLTNSEYLDSTFATFRVQKVLRGKYSEKNIEVIFPDHLGFADNSTFIVFITFDMKLVAGNRKLGNCQKTPCFYSKSDWLLDNTKKNFSAVSKLLKIKR